MAKHQFRKMEKAFFRKTLATFLLLLFIPISTMGSISFYIIHNYVRKSQTREVQVLMEQAMSRANLAIKVMEPLVRSASIDGYTSYISRKLLDSQQLTYTDIYLLNILKDHLSTVKNVTQWIQSIIIYYPNELEQYITNSGKKFIYQENPSWHDSLEEHHNSTAPWTIPTMSKRVDGNFMHQLVLCYPLTSGDGVIAFQISSELLEKVIISELTAGGHHLSICNPDGTLLMGNVPEVDTDMLKRSYFVQTAEIESTGWQLSLYSPKRLVFQVYKWILGFFLLFSCIAILAGITFAMLLARKRTSQIYNIIDLIQTAEEGGHLATFDHQNNDEETYDYIVHSLIKSFLQQNYLKAQLEARKYKLENAQLLALQAQLNPHFLYNTLETLNWKIYQMDRRPNEATKMIEYLSSILRYALCEETSKVLVEEEFHYAQCYVALQKIRYKEKFSISFKLTEDCAKLMMPRMILQPLIENAISHGVKSLNRNGHIEITGNKEDGKLVISIEDDGVGIERKKLDELRDLLSHSENPGHQNIGLRNVNARLSLSYGESVTVDSRPSGGFIVVFKIPAEIE